MIAYFVNFSRVSRDSFYLQIFRHLFTICKSFVWPHLDYGNIVYNRAFNFIFHKNLESVQYNAATAITEVIRALSSEKLFQELGLESLTSRRWLRRLFLFYKVFYEKFPWYLFNWFHQTRCSQINKMPSFKIR